MSNLSTCISCRVAFESATEQRSHFSTDWHRYNMKRRVAELPPLPASTFNERVIERREQNAIRIDPRSLECSTCRKQFSTENAFRSHVQSKKHRDREAQAATQRGTSSIAQEAPQQAVATTSQTESDDAEAMGSEDDQDDADIEDRIAMARQKLRPNECLFCSRQSTDVDANLAHMSAIHSFFIPYRDELSDLPGLLGYLGQKVAEGFLCLFCPNGGKEFNSLEAVRRHMIDKGHCRVAFSSDEDQAELADFYWQDAGGDDDGDWEDDANCEDDAPPVQQVALAGDGLSLTLSSGRTLGHRSLKVYYNQRLGAGRVNSGSTSRNQQKVLAVRQRLADPSQALISIAGGHGAYGRGLEVMQAKNAGEASWAKRQARSHMDQRRREAFRTIVGFKHNNQKHFRDPLLQ